MKTQGVNGPKIVEYAGELIRNPNLIKDEDFKAKMRKEAEESKYNTVIHPKEEKVGLFTILQPSDEYRKCFLMTAIMAYFHRVGREYKVPEGEAKSIFKAYSEAFGAPKKAQPTREATDAISKMSSEIVGRFLQYFTEYDPDKHVMKAYKENLADPDRMVAQGKFVKHMRNEQVHRKKGTLNVGAEAKSALGELLEFARTSGSGISLEKLALIESTFIDQYDHEQKLISNYKSLLKMVESCIDLVRALDNYTRQIKIDLPEGHNYENYLIWLIKNKARIERQIDIMEQNSPMNEDLKYIVNRDIAYDRFYHFQRYYENFYEQLKEATTVLFPWKEDIDVMMQFYDAFPVDKSKDEENSKVSEFFSKYSSVVKFDVSAVETGSWHILGPYDKNKDRCSFYNKNSTVLEAILKNAEINNKIGADIAKHRAKKTKAEELKNAGPDPQAIEDYQKYSKGLYDVDTKNVMTKEERQKAATEQWRDTSDCPDGSEQYNYFSTDGEDVKFGKIYSDVLEKDSDFGKDIDEYSEKVLGRKYLVARDGTKTKKQDVQRELKEAFDGDL